MHQESLPVRLARQSLEQYLRNHSLPAAPPNLPMELQRRAGVFVSLKKQGELRGCIGTFLPTTDSIAQEIMTNAVSAGTEDPRFWPVELEELAELDISVDILSEPEAVNSIDELDAKRYGVIVRRGQRTGLLLPDLEGVDTPQQQISIAKQKAGIDPGEKVELYRFYVTRYK